MKEIIKKIVKASKRGLTFSFDSTKNFYPGQRYRYVLDKKSGRMIIFPEANNSNKSSLKISRKKTKKCDKALFDFRNKEIKEIMREADYVQIEVLKEEIIVSLLRNKCAKRKVMPFKEYVEVMHEFRIPMTCLKASGDTTAYYQYTLNDIFNQQTLNEIRNEVVDKIKADIPQVLKVISLFSGAGMLDLPFHNDENFKIVYAADTDEDACRTYKENIGSHIHNIDIRYLKGEDLPKADIIIGGPPCQPYTTENHSKKGEDHEEGDMFYEFLRLIRETNISCFVIENVPELLTASYGISLGTIKHLLPGYEVEAKLVRDSDVGGFTNRKRIVIVGSRLGKVLIPDLVIRPVHTVNEAFNKLNDRWPNYKDLTKNSSEVKERISLIPEGGNWEDLPEQLRTSGKHSNSYRRLDRNKPSVTICNWRKYLLSPPRYDSSGYWDRILTVAEAAALSGLNATFRFCGKLSSMQQQVGNGVPQAIGKFIKNIIKRIYQQCKNVNTFDNMIQEG